MIKVDLGSGYQAMEVKDYIHIDIADLPHIEYVHDLNCGLPIVGEDRVFEDNSVDEFRCHHTAEHLTHEGFMVLMNDMHDALKKDGVLHLYTPNAEHIRAAHSDPTHRLVFTRWTFDYFTKESLAAYPYTTKAWRILEGYPKVNGSEGDWWELEWVLQPDK